MLKAGLELAQLARQPRACEALSGVRFLIGRSRPGVSE
jgi:hypothetical protein